MRVLKQPTVTFTCRNCGAVCEADTKDFTPHPHKDIIWNVKCGACRIENTMSVPELVGRKIDSMFP